MIAQSGMDILKPVPLLGAMSPETFMRTHWQKKPLLVRQAVPGGAALQTRAELFGLAGREGVESRLIVHDESGWTLRHGPIPRRAWPKVDQPRWTVLVQGIASRAGRSTPVEAIGLGGPDAGIVRMDATIVCGRRFVA